MYGFTHSFINYCLRICHNPISTKISSVHNLSKVADSVLKLITKVLVREAVPYVLDRRRRSLHTKELSVITSRLFIVYSFTALFLSLSPSVKNRPRIYVASTASVRLATDSINRTDIGVHRRPRHPQSSFNGSRRLNRQIYSHNYASKQSRLIDNFMHRQCM